MPVNDMTVAFKNYCTCGGYAWRMNGRDPADPHMDYCRQREEYLEWWKQQSPKGIDDGR
jgi:hypothetical protein